MARGPIKITSDAGGAKALRCTDVDAIGRLAGLFGGRSHRCASKS